MFTNLIIRLTELTREDSVPTASLSGGVVNGLASAGVLFRSVVKELRRDGIKFDQSRLHLSLVNDFGTGVYSGLGQVLGLTDIEVTRFATFDVSARATDIRILRGLSPVRFQVVAAHELGHVWLANRKAVALPDWCCEGFCELVAYRFEESTN